MKKKNGFVLWFTGLSGAGKSTLADEVYSRLQKAGTTIERLDGDEVRTHLTSDLGFSKEDRDKNIERISFVAKLLSRNGIGVICTFISPYRAKREEVRNSTNNFIEVFVNAPLSVCEERDVKGLYQKARKGEIQNFTGISDPYETPENPEIEVRTDKVSIEAGAEQIIDYLEEKGLLL